MNNKSDSLELVRGRGTWVQTERSGHEAWSDFLELKGALTASRVLHLLISQMGDKNAVVISQHALAERMRVDVRTVRRAIALLKEHNWVQTVSLGGAKSGVQAYIVNSRLAWYGPRDGIRCSVFDARVYATTSEQDENENQIQPLHRLPEMFPGESQLPSGPGLPPISQPFFNGMEPDMPALKRAYDSETGEIE